MCYFLKITDIHIYLHKITNNLFVYKTKSNKIIVSHHNPVGIDSIVLGSGEGIDLADPERTGPGVGIGLVESALEDIVPEDTVPEEDIVLEEGIALEFEGGIDKTIMNCNLKPFHDSILTSMGLVFQHIIRHV